MKKSQKWILISMMIVFAIIIPIIYLIISDIGIKDLPLWTTIGVPVVILVVTFITFLIQPKVENLSTQKRRKFLLILLAVYIVFLFIMSMIRGTSFLKINDITSLINYLFFLTVFLYAFFRKDKEQNPNEKPKETDLND